MPRYARQEDPGSLQHLISRFVNREYRFTCAAERDEYLRRVAKAILHTDIDLLAYCLMSSHLHWAAFILALTSAAFIHPLHSGFAPWLNRRQGRLGPVFAGRHESIGLPEEHIARLVAYIHNNPVRGKVVSDPADSTWSSHRAFIGDVAPPPWLNVKRTLAACGFSSSPSGRLSFHDFVRSRSGDPRDPTLSGGDPARARAVVRRLAGTPAEISSPTLDEERLRHEIRVAEEAPIRPRWPGPPSDAAAVVALLAGTSVERLRSRDRSRELVEVRRLALLVWTDYLGREQQTMSTFLGLSLPSGSRLLRKSGPLNRLEPEATLAAQVCWRKAQ